MGKRAYNKADKARGVKLRDLGCIVCLLERNLFTEPAIHHIDGQTKPGCHQNTIPLCGNHHQIPDTAKPPRWLALHHDGKFAHGEKYGDEQYLLTETNRLINNCKGMQHGFN